MIKMNLKSYSWAVPHLLIFIWLALYAGAGNAAKENRPFSTHSATASPTTVFHTNGMGFEPFSPSVSQTPSREKAKEGETVNLGCKFRSSHGSSLNNLTVKWYKEDENGSGDLLENNITVLANYTRAFLRGDLSEGDASLTILNVTTSDHGTYFCQVTLSNGDVVTGGGTKLRIRRALVCEPPSKVAPHTVECIAVVQAGDNQSMNHSCKSPQAGRVCLPDGALDTKETCASTDSCESKISQSSHLSNCCMYGLFGIEESIGTIIGVVAAGIGGLLVLIVVLTPQLRKCLPCGKATSNQV